ncbi:UNVERIFIED_ORG: hypothetical protein FHR35_003838 [Microbispora rosea subsp. rosea]|nr:hypothetical protein Misp03_08050 [Microbispora sp. NBRC 16548]
MRWRTVNSPLVVKARGAVAARVISGECTETAPSRKTVFRSGRGGAPRTRLYSYA